MIRAAFDAAGHGGTFPLSATSESISQQQLASEMCAGLRIARPHAHVREVEQQQRYLAERSPKRRWQSQFAVEQRSVVRACCLAGDRVELEGACVLYV